MNIIKSNTRYCECGRELYPKRNSTIYPIRCPNCEFKLAYSSKIETRKKNGKTKKQKTPRQKAMDRADDWFSRYIRCKYAFESNGEWFCKCYTCGYHHKVTLIQNGHWQRRGFKTTRFHEDDARPQCVKCNYHRSGEPERFEINLIKEIGIDRVLELKKLSQELGEDNEVFYREQANKYRILTNEILKLKKGLKWW